MERVETAVTKGNDLTGSGPLNQVCRSPWTRWIGLRYLKSKKNSKFLSFITMISILGVALGVTSMIVVLSVMNGFEAELRKRLMASDLHVLITPTNKVTGFDSGYVPKDAIDAARLIKAVGEKNVVNLLPVVSTEVILKTGRKVTGAMIKGVTPERLERLKTQITESAEPQMLIDRDGPHESRLPGIFVGQELAYEMGLIPGDRITVISPTDTEGPMATVPRMKRFVIEGIYHSGLPEQELHVVFTSEGSARAFLRRVDAVSQWELTASDFDAAPKLASKIRDMVPDFRVEDWIQLNSHLFASLRLERIAMFIILAFIVIVASFNIVTTLTLMVLEKKREVSILKAMGARDGQVGAIFLSEGLFIGILGTGLGILAGFVICSILKRYEFITLPDVYYDRTLPVTFDPLYYLIVASAAILIVVAACLYPSKRAAAMNPLDGIRFGR
jgi:lipoprotein-releasing system permease protein